jgi:PHD/YefM family antitoxin component YafN of YafNO toxin-antitoxin module
MNTQFVGIKDFRQKIAEYAKKASTNKTRYVVMSHSKPLFELKPFDEDETLDSFVADIMEARKAVSAGEVVSEKEILAEFA